MKHTPEPWRLCDPPDFFVVPECPAIQAPGESIDECEANAARIVACVNACAGIADPADLRRQRDELLAVAKRLVGIIKAHDLESLSCDRDGHEFCECLGDAVVAARAAIANAETQPKE